VGGAVRGSGGREAWRPSWVTWGGEEWGGVGGVGQGGPEWAVHVRLVRWVSWATIVWAQRQLREQKDYPILLGFDSEKFDSNSNNFEMDLETKALNNTKVMQGSMNVASLVQILYLK
jgi:hypothetical protein